MFKNNKGFMLAEVVITSTIILTALVSLYVTFNKLYSNYNTRNSYYNIDGFYAIKGMINYLIDSGKLNEILNDQEKGYKDGKFYFISKSNENGSKCNEQYLKNSEYCNQLQSLYKVNNMVIVEYNKDALSGLKIDSISETFKDYIDYVINYYDFSNKEDYNYLILMEYNNQENGKYNYANIGVW